MSKTSLKTTVEWNQVNWRKLELRVYKLQTRIYRASQRGDVKTVRRLQKTLMKSWSARAVQAIFNAIRYKTKYVLDADIAKCFDRIDHEALLKKLNTFPTIRRQVRAWLKAGVMDNMQYLQTSEGTPQGGVISPLLANIALHGMEERIKQYAETLKGEKRENRKSLSLIRYADDFVILHENITVVQRCKEIIFEWLQGMGLELKPSKTRLAHTLNQCEQEKPCFDFLGRVIN